MRDHYPRCPECSAEVARWSRLTGALASGRGEGHPSEERLLVYQSRPEALARDERRALESHLQGCAPCRSELAVLAGFDFAALGVREQSAAVRRRDAPGLAERIAGMLDALGERWFGGLARPALVAAALLALALPAGLLGWWLTSRTAGQPAPAPIARSQPAPSPLTPEPLAPGLAPEVEPPSQQLARGPSPAPVPEITPPETPVAPAPAEPAPEPQRIAARPDEADAPVLPSDAPAAGEPIRIAALLPDELPRYQPDPMLAGGSLESIRSSVVVRAGVEGGPEIFALGPDHVGATREPAPVLYWYLSGPSDAPVELSVSAENAVEPLLELRIEPPVAAGLHALDLSGQGVVLAPGITHHWYATIVRDPDQRDADLTSGAAVRRTPAGPALASRLASAGPSEQASVLAAFGYWYDAFDTLSAWSAAEPEAEALRRHRAALLEQVGLAGVARAAFGPGS